MPKVGRSHFPYTPAGIKAAKKFAKMTGQKVVNTQPTEFMMSPQAQFAGLVPQTPAPSKMDPDKMMEKVDNAKEEKADKKKKKKLFKRK